MRSSIILILCVFFTSSIMAKTLKDEKKNHHQHSKTIVHTIKHSKAIKNYYNLNRVHTDLVNGKHIIDRKINHNKISKSSVQCVAETIYSESRGESLRGQIAVGNTIMRRTQILDKNPCSVVKQQYTQKSVPYKDKEEFYSLASDVLNGIPTSPNFDSFDSFKGKHHHRKGAVKIGNHYFYTALKS